MRRWVLTGTAVLVLLVLLSLWLGTSPVKTNLPDSTTILQQSSLSVPSEMHSPFQLVGHLLSYLPIDVIIIFILFLGAGIAINFNPLPDIPQESVVLNPGWCGLVGSVIWIFASIDAALTGLHLSQIFYTSPVFIHWLGGVVLQSVLLSSVVCLLYFANSATINHLIDTVKTFGQASVEGLREYLRFYPYLLLGLFLNEWLVLRLSSPDLPVSYRFIASANTFLDYCLLFVLIAVLAPIVEEYFFRGIIYGSLRDYLSTYSACLFGGLIFGLVHFEVQLFLPLWLIGVFLCFVYERTGSIKVVITMHFLQNTVSFYMLTRII